MKISVENLGAIRYAEMEMGKLTVLCGMNNSGKTYMTYAIYGFLNFWHNEYTIQIEKEKLKKLKDNGVVNLPLKDYVCNAQDTISNACQEYSKNLYKVYSAQEKLFFNSKFTIHIDEDEVSLIDDDFSHGIKTTSAKATVLSVKKERLESELIVTLFTENTEEEIPDFILVNTISDSIKETVFKGIFPGFFIASAERTGAAIFRQELNFARNRMLETVSKKDASINPIELLRSQMSDYALPVEHNVEYTRKLESISKSESFISKNHKDVIEAFKDILGGDYQVSKSSELYFVPNGKNIKLTMDESSSAVRSLLDVAFYLKCTTKAHV